MTSNSPWTPAEDDYLRNNYLAVPASEIGSHLHRSPRAVRLRAGRLGLAENRQPDWTAADLNILRQQFRQGVDLDALASRLGRTVKAVTTRASMLGIRRRQHRQQNGGRRS